MSDKRDERKGLRQAESRTLPLQDHALELVIQDEGLDADVVLRCRRKFHRRHASTLR